MIVHTLQRKGENELKKHENPFLIDWDSVN